MPQPQQTKLYRTFVKGLITEASPLTYPENSSFDEDNLVLSRKGNRSRRLGIDFEANFELSADQVTADQAPDYGDVDAGLAINTYSWLAAANDSTVNFDVIQFGEFLYVYDSSAVPKSGGLVHVIELAPFAFPAGSSVFDKDVSMVAGKGILFVAGEQLDPFYVTYNPDTAAFTTVKILVQVRDFIGIPLGSGAGQDTAGLSSNPVSLSIQHKYNLRNQGWGLNAAATHGFGDTITAFDNDLGKYPSNSQIWWVGKNTDVPVEFDPRKVDRFEFGNTRAAQGHFILNAFYKDRAAAAFIPGLPVEAIKNRPASVSFFSGRVWWILNSTVYYSQVFDDNSKIGYCYQANDPTAEEFSDLLDTDGGTIEIPEIGKGLKLFPAGSGILIFGTNGIWYIAGGTTGFTAKEFVVTKVSPIGTESPNSIVEAEGQIFWWSKIGIQGMSQKSGLFGPVEGSFDKVSLSEQTIQTFFLDIPVDSKLHVKGIFDPLANTVIWMFKTHDQVSEYLYNRLLILDLTLQAFYPWTIPSFVDRGPFIVGAFVSPRFNAVMDVFAVKKKHDNVVIGTNRIVVTEDTEDIRRATLNFVLAYPDTVNSRYSITMGGFTNNTFADWVAYDTVDHTGVAFNSYLETGYELLEDAMRNKFAPYVFCYFRRTEQNFISGTHGVEVDKPSSCTLLVKWEWSDTSTSNKWADPVEAYRIIRAPIPSGPGVYDNGFPVVVTKNRIRGNGRAIQFRFENGDIGSDFDLLGWSVQYSGAPVP